MLSGAVFANCFRKLDFPRRFATAVTLAVLRRVLEPSERHTEFSPDLLRQARSGEPAALGQLLELLRPWMRILADARMGSEVAARVDASDIVQQTCLSVFNRIQQFQGQEIAQFMAWVREIHTHNVQDVVRGHLVAQERSVLREQPWEDVDATLLAVEGSNPSFFLGDKAILLAKAMEQLPDAQRKATAMRYLEGLPVSRISELMNLTPDAVTSLIRRGLQQLRTQIRSL